jgi:uncharacterized tellurite resistance protein B-like protein
MVEYSYQQKLAIMRILLDIIHADGIIDAREKFFYDQLKEQFELTDEDHEAVRQKNSLLALLQIRSFTEEQKMGLALYMSKMIVVDKDINANELAIYDVVRDFCGISKNFEESFSPTELDEFSHS